MAQVNQRFGASCYPHRLPWTWRQYIHPRLW